MSVTLRLYDGTTGALTRLLPLAGSIEFQDPLNEEGYATLRYPKAADGYSALVSVMQSTSAEVGVHLDGPEVFRFTIEDDELDDADGAGNAGMLTVAGPGTLALLNRGITLPPGGIGTTPTVRQFTGATAGGVMSTFLTLNQDAGYCTEITTTFTATTDSAGNAWTKTLDKDYETGQDLLSVVRELCDLGFCDVKMVGHTLYLYNADTTLGQTLPIYVRRAHVKSAPRKRSRKELHTDLLVVGDNGVNVLRSDTAARSQYGIRLGFVGQSDFTSTTSLNYVGDQQLTVYARPQIGYTYTLNLDHATCPRPFSDFTVGARIHSDLAPVSDAPGVLRVRSIACTLDESGPTQASIELADRFRSPNILLKRKLDRLIPGVDPSTASLSAGGGGGAVLWVGPEAPTDGSVFWFDTDEPA